MNWTGLDELSLENHLFCEKQEKFVKSELRRFVCEWNESLVGNNFSWEIERLLRYIHSNLFTNGTNVSTAKRECKIRGNSASSRFRRALGLSIREYIESLRLKAAERLLRYEDLPIYRIAHSVGYDHEETFYRAFQRRFDRTPSQHRAALLEASNNNRPETDKTGLQD